MTNPNHGPSGRIFPNRALVDGQNIGDDFRRNAFNRFELSLKNNAVLGII
jgi:hypothetical protein